MFPRHVSRKLRPFIVFMHELLTYMPDLVLHECTHLFNVKNLEHYLGKHYFVMAANMSPLEYGWPYSRPRKLTWCVKKETMYVNRTFTLATLAAFQHSTSLEGDVFFAAPDEEVDQDHVKAQQRRKCLLRSEAWLGPGDFVRI